MTVFSDDQGVHAWKAQSASAPHAGRIPGRLQTHHLDLWQIHGVCFENDPDLFMLSHDFRFSIPTKNYDGDIGREQHGYLNSEELPA